MTNEEFNEMIDQLRSSLSDLALTVGSVSNKMGHSTEGIDRTNEALGRLSRNSKDAADAVGKGAAFEAAKNKALEAELELEALHRAAQTQSIATIKSFGSALMSSTQSLAKYNSTLDAAGSSLSALAGTFGTMGKVAGVFITAGTAMVKSAMTYADNMLKAADDINRVGAMGSVTTDELQKLAAGAKYTSTTIQGWTKALGSMGTSLGALGGGVGDGVKEFSKLTTLTRQQITHYQNLGYSQAELTQAQADSIGYMKRSGVALTEKMKTDGTIQKLSLEYVNSLSQLSALTGKSVEEAKKIKEMAMAHTGLQVRYAQMDAEEKRLRAAGRKDEADQIVAEKERMKKIAEMAEASGESEENKAAIKRYLATGQVTQESAAFFQGDPERKKALDEMRAGQREIRELPFVLADSNQRAAERAGPAARYSDENAKRFGFSQQGVLGTAQWSKMTDEERAKWIKSSDVPKETKGEKEGSAEKLRATQQEAEQKMQELRDKMISSMGVLNLAFAGGAVVMGALAIAAAKAAVSLGGIGGGSLLGSLGDLLGKGKGGPGAPGGGMGGKIKDFFKTGGMSRAFDAVRGLAGSALTQIKGVGGKALEFFKGGGMSRIVESVRGLTGSAFTNIKSVGGKALDVIKSNKMGLLKGVGGLLGGMALDWGAGKAEAAGHKKTAAGLSIGSSALSGAGIGATIGSVIPGVGTVIGGAVGGVLGAGYGLIKKGGQLFGSEDKKEEDKKEEDKKEEDKKKTDSSDSNSIYAQLRKLYLSKEIIDLYAIHKPGTSSTKGIGIGAASGITEGPDGIKEAAKKEKGMGIGAAFGAVLGTVFMPGIGTLIGGALGKKFDDWRKGDKEKESKPEDESKRGPIGDPLLMSPAARYSDEAAERLAAHKKTLSLIEKASILKGKDKLPNGPDGIKDDTSKRGPISDPLLMGPAARYSDEAAKRLGVEPPTEKKDISSGTKDELMMIATDLLSKFNIQLYDATNNLEALNSLYDKQDKILDRGIKSGGMGGYNISSGNRARQNQSGVTGEATDAEKKPRQNQERPPGSPSTQQGEITDKQAFYNKMHASLLDAAKRKGVENPEVIARLGAAQAMQETGGGKHMVGNNAFGIKAAKGQASVDAMTNEHLNGKDVRLSQKFAKFKDLEEGADAYIDFLQKNKRQRPLLEQKDVGSAIDTIGKTGYATDPKYRYALASLDAKYSQGLKPGPTGPGYELQGESKPGIKPSQPGPGYDLQKESSPLGLKIKSAESTAGGAAHPELVSLAKNIQTSLGPELKQFTALNDKYHQGTNSKHAKGEALDLTLTDPKKAAEITAMLSKMPGVKKVLNEYADPSKRSTGGHLHVELEKGKQDLTAMLAAASKEKDSLANKNKEIDAAKDKMITQSPASNQFAKLDQANQPVDPLSAEALKPSFVDSLGESFASLKDTLSSHLETLISHTQEANDTRNKMAKNTA